MTNEMKPFGNINKETLFDIWNSNKVKIFNTKCFAMAQSLWIILVRFVMVQLHLHPEDNLDNDSERLKRIL